MRKRKFALVTATALAITALAGCGAEPAPTSSGPVTLTFATYHWLEKGRGDVMWKVIESYTKTHPNVTIEQVSYSRADYEKTLSTQIGSGKGPDLLHAPDPFFFELEDAGALVSLEDVLDDAGKASLTSENELYVVDGKPYAFVWETAGYGFFYDKRVLADHGITAPTTFEELVAAAKQLTAETGKPAIATRHLMNEESAWWNDHLAWIYGVGGDLSDGSNLTLNSPANIQAETYFKELYDSGAFAVGDDSATFREKFKQGAIPMLIDAAGTQVSLTKGNAIVPPESVGSSLIPFPSKGTQFIGGGLAINANSAHVVEAKEFLRWMYSPEIQTQLAEGMFPSLVGTNIEVPKHLFTEFPWFQPIYEGLKSNPKPVVIRGFELKTPQVRTIFLTQIERVLTQDVDVTEALNEAQRQAEEVVRH